MGKDRPWANITFRLPVDLIDELKEITPMLGWSRYETVMRRYIARGLGEDLERLRGSQAASLTESLRRNGVGDEVIALAITEAELSS
jgi:hypothetical protein